jgi:hypothetical protein
MVVGMIYLRDMAKNSKKWENIAMDKYLRQLFWEYVQVFQICINFFGF